MGTSHTKEAPDIPKSRYNAQAGQLHGPPHRTPVLHQHRPRLLFQTRRTSHRVLLSQPRESKRALLALTHKSRCLTKPGECVSGGIKQNWFSLAYRSHPNPSQTDRLQFPTAGKHTLCLQLSLPNGNIKSIHKIINFQPVTLKFHVDNKRIINLHDDLSIICMGGGGGGEIRFFLLLHKNNRNI